MNPIEVVREAIRKVPAIKYALGIAGIGAVVSIIKSFAVEDFSIPLISIIIMIGLMVLLYLFALITKSQDNIIKVGSYILVYTTVVLACLSSLLLASSVFFDYPKPINNYWFFERLKNDTALMHLPTNDTNDIEHVNSKKHNSDLIVASKKNLPLNSVKHSKPTEAKLYTKDTIGGQIIKEKIYPVNQLQDSDISNKSELNDPNKIRIHDTIKIVKTFDSKSGDRDSNGELSTCLVLKRNTYYRIFYKITIQDLDKDGDVNSGNISISIPETMVEWILGKQYFVSKKLISGERGFQTNDNTNYHFVLKLIDVKRNSRKYRYDEEFNILLDVSASEQ